MIIKITLKPPFEKAIIEFNHRLKFNPSKSSKKPYVSQSYDEIVLNKIPPAMLDEYEKLVNNREYTLAKIDNVAPDLGELLTSLNEDSRIDVLEHDTLYTNAIEFVEEEIKTILQKTRNIQTELKNKYEDLTKQGN